MAPRPPFCLTPPSDAERVQQIDCTKMLEGVLRPEVTWTAVDHAHSLNMTIGRNGRPIGIMEAVRRQAQGVKPGIPDYLFWSDSYAYAIEFKIDDGELTTDEKDFLRKLIASGTICKVCWGSVQVMNTVFQWGLVRPQVRWSVAA